ncbi:MAG TPA: M48 family metallopeptidase [candidate division Zixibacteria bacterium]|nr:M48 family metallopeptidase [candidate division Zixibacteria bacterium]
MYRHILSIIIGLSVIILCGAVVAADDSIDMTTNTTDTLSATAGVTVDDAAINAETEEPLMTPERREKLNEYSRIVNRWRFVSFFIGLVITALILFTGFSARMRTWAQVAKKKFFILWLFLAMYLVVDYILSLPMSIYRSFIVESDFGFMNQTFWGWFGEDLLWLLIGVVIAIIPAWFFYLAVSRLKRWWLAFSIGAIPFIIFAVVIAPVVISPLFNNFEPLKNKQLKAEIESLADKAGIEGSDIFQVNGSKQSSKVNAYVTGLFGTKRIVLYDTLIDNFSDKEILFVMGHEMGHYVMHHIWWGLGISILFIMFALWLTDRTIRWVIHKFRKQFGFSELTDYASLPLVMLFISIISFVFQPITNYSSRVMEYQADRFGMEVAGIDADTAVSAFDKLSACNLSDPEPPALIEFWFYDHPTLSKRKAALKELAEKRIQTGDRRK